MKLCPRYEDGIFVVGGWAKEQMKAKQNKQKFIFFPGNYGRYYVIAWTLADSSDYIKNQVALLDYSCECLKDFFCNVLSA